MTALVLPRCLSTAAPGWSISADVIVVGSGVAGLTTALNARRSGFSVLLVTKAHVDEGSTRWAQGGIAAALADDDSPEEHLHDTLVAGAGLCDVEAVRILASEGPKAIADLVEIGARFDVDPTGRMMMTREGGHLRNRIIHAGGDATGAEISRALVAAVALDPGIELIENALVLDLLLDEHGGAQGVTLHVMGEGQAHGVGAALAPAIVLATGGIGQVFAQTTNPYVATGDGIALALRAGADIADVEFVQFHPTVLWLGPLARGQQPLVSEAVRGEGAFLIDSTGERFMQAEHPLADLAPRDVVAKAIMRRIRESGIPHVWLDGRHLGADVWIHRFPTILESCRSHGIDPVTQLIPVRPAQHYASGGIYTDHEGRASIPGLYACGEAACTGVHGANRLASNSLLEGLVFARRIGDALAGGLPRRLPVQLQEHHGGLFSNRTRRTMQQIMDVDAGVLRSAHSLADAATKLALMRDEEAKQATEDWETTNLHALSSLLVQHARLREETRGSHWREDFPDQDDEHWQVRLVSRVQEDGSVMTRQEAVTR